MVAGTADSAKPRELTPAEKVAAIMQSPAVVAKLGERNPEQASKDMQDIVDGYFKGHEAAVLLAYIEDVRELEEMRLNVDPTPKQIADIKAAEKNAAAAFTKVEKIMDASGAVPAEKNAVKLVAQTYATQAAPEEHQKMLAGIIEHITGDKAKGWLSDTTANVMERIGKGNVKEADIKELDGLVARQFPGLSANDRKVVTDSLVSAAPGQAAEIAKANPLSNITGQAALQARDALTNLPKTLATEAVTSAATGLPPGAATALTGAKRFFNL